MLKDTLIARTGPKLLLVHGAGTGLLTATDRSRRLLAARLRNAMPVFELDCDQGGGMQRSVVSTAFTRAMHASSVGSSYQEHQN